MPLPSDRPHAAVRFLLPIVALLVILAACSPMSGGTGQTAAASPTTQADGTGPAPTTAAPARTSVPSNGSAPSRPPLTADEALTLVIEEHPRYEGYPLRAVAEPSGSAGPILGGGLIGQSRWVIARQVTAGIELTFVTGSGDCPAGCIEHAYDTYLVEPDGTVTFVCSEADGPAGRTPEGTGRAAGLPFEPCAGVPSAS